MAQLVPGTTLGTAPLWLPIMPWRVASRPSIDVSSPEKRPLLAVLAEAITTLRRSDQRAQPPWQTPLR